MAERAQQIKIRHSRNSKLKLAKARQALNVIHEITYDLAAEVARLCAVGASGTAWRAFLDRCPRTRTAAAPWPSASGTRADPAV